MAAGHVARRQHLVLDKLHDKLCSKGHGHREQIGVLRRLAAPILRLVLIEVMQRVAPSFLHVAPVDLAGDLVVCRDAHERGQERAEMGRIMISCGIAAERAGGVGCG